MAKVLGFILMLITSYVSGCWGFSLQLGGFHFELPPIFGNPGNGNGNGNGNSNGNGHGNGKGKGNPNPLPDSGTPSSGAPGLQVGFYKGKCPSKFTDVEALIASKVHEQFRKDPTLLPAILRMQFHDCFVHGCDASILIDGSSSERNAFPNLSVRGYEFIDDLKATLEQLCPGVVSCADIIAIVTKQLIQLGGGPDYVVQTGRRDGFVSNMNDVNLPSPFMTVPQSIAAFQDKGFTAEEMVILLGCHTVGISHCAFFEGRLYRGTNQFDPNMDPNLRGRLIQTCPQGTNSNNVTFLDQNPTSSNRVDNSFFDQIKRNRGILPIDQALARDPQTSPIVQELSLNSEVFNAKLSSAMIKLQALEVLTGDQGEVRNVCSKFN